MSEAKLEWVSSENQLISSKDGLNYNRIEQELTVINKQLQESIESTSDILKSVDGVINDEKQAG